MGSRGRRTGRLSATALTPAERRLIARLRTPAAVQRWLRSLRYNHERDGQTVRSFRMVVRQKEAHCLEGALAAATVLERHGHPPLILDLESSDRLDHVVFAFRHRGRWGAVGASRDEGLFGRRAVFRTPRHLAMSYFEPYINLTGRITAWALADLRVLGGYDWRFSERNLWKVERYLITLPHQRLRSSDARYRRLRDRYREFVATNPPWRTPFTRGRRYWM